MPAAIINKYPVVRPEEGADCAIICLSLYLGVPYDDVLREVALVDKRNKGRAGMWTRQIKQVGRALGTRLVIKKHIDWEDDYGIVLLADHVVMLRNGLVFDTNGHICDAADYHAMNPKERFEGILVAAEPFMDGAGANAQSV